MENYGRTDLACEMPRGADGRGVHARRESRYGIETEETVIAPGIGEKETGRRAGRYATLHCGKIWLLDKEESTRTAKAIASVLASFIEAATGKMPGHDCSVLIAGLGNRFITPDSIGPRTTDLVTVTRHAGDEHLPAILGCASVSALAPGVLGQTGIEAASLVADAARAAQAQAIIAVDALAARSTARLATTIQIADTGIQPGSGIGNCRAAITKESCGVPVIALGVPTVVDSSTLVWDALEKAGIDSPCEELIRVLEDGRGYVVSPRESDQIASSVSALLAAALNRLFTPALQ